VPGTVDFLFLPDGADPEFDEKSWDKAMKPDWAVPLLRDVRMAYASLGSWDAAALKESIEATMAAYEIKLGKAQAPVRVAVTGRSVGPPLFESLEVLGRAETLRRIDAALARVGD
jgi:glutamyl-tRNA synthetase